MVAPRFEPKLLTTTVIVILSLSLCELELSECWGLEDMPYVEG